MRYKLLILFLLFASTAHADYVEYNIPDAGKIYWNENGLIFASENGDQTKYRFINTVNDQVISGSVIDIMKFKEINDDRHEVIILHNKSKHFSVIATTYDGKDKGSWNVDDRYALFHKE